MIGINIKSSLRYLSKHKLFTGINVVGMGVAFCAVFFAWQYVDFELGYDQTNPLKDRIYRVSADVRSENGLLHETSPEALARTIEAKFPEVESVGRLFLDYYIVNKPNEPATEEMLAYADPSIFSLLNIDLLKGEMDHVFDTKFSLVLDRSTAIRYFQTIDCLGETLMLDGSQPATITGVMEDLPRNTHFKAGFFLSMSSLVAPGSSWSSNWGRYGFSTYVLLRKAADPEQFSRHLQSIPAEHPIKSGASYSLVAEPLNTLYFEGTLRGNKAGASVSGSRTNIYIFSAVALFVLLIAIFNFVNLSTALSLNRAKEIAVRKVNGASFLQLFLQFMTDAIILALLAYLISIALIFLFTGSFNKLAGKTVVDGLPSLRYIAGFFGVAFGSGCIAGIYPAIYLARLMPSDSLRSATRKTGKPVLRKVLVVTQFFLSMVLMVSTIVVSRQLYHLQNEQLGFSKQHNLVIDYHYSAAVQDHREAVRSRLMRLPFISNASFTSCVPGRRNRTFPTDFVTADGHKLVLQTDAWFADQYLLDQYGIKLLAGRVLLPSDAEPGKQNMLINRTAALKLGYTNPADALGKPTEQRGNTGVIVGVMEDFIFQPGRELIAPLCIQYSQGFFTFLSLSLTEGNVNANLKILQQEWSAIAPDLPLVYFFADETYDQLYKSEQQFRLLFTTLAVLAIIIAALGLLGLAAFTTIQRKKEIGIRKTIGASVTNIILLLSKDLLRLVLLAFLIAAPVAWILMNSWLEGFEHRIELSVWMPIAGGVLAFLIATITVWLFVYSAARASPVKAIKENN